jgi:hypothetical protein
MEYQCEIFSEDGDATLILDDQRFECPNQLSAMERAKDRFLTDGLAKSCQKRPDGIQLRDQSGEEIWRWDPSFGM